MSYSSEKVYGLMLTSNNNESSFLMEAFYDIVHLHQRTESYSSKKVYGCMLTSNNNESSFPFHYMGGRSPREGILPAARLEPLISQ